MPLVAARTRTETPVALVRLNAVARPAASIPSTVLLVDHVIVSPGIAAPPESLGCAAKRCVSPTKFNAAGLGGVTAMLPMTCRTTSGTLSRAVRATTTIVSRPLFELPVIKPLAAPMDAMVPRLQRPRTALWVRHDGASGITHDEPELQGSVQSIDHGRVDDRR